MGFGIRAFVAVLLALISLSVLSLHVALCFHYPSALFAVTLLLNPSLWLFVGLMSMFCTMLLSFRDRRRKLVPALCTSCRPRHEGSLLWVSRNRLHQRHFRQHSGCRCSERSLLACHYSSDSSVHTTTQLLSTNSEPSQPMTEVPGSTVTNENSTDAENESLISLDHSFKEDLQASLNGTEQKEQLNDVQNFSCLLEDNCYQRRQSTVVMVGKDGGTKSICSNKENTQPQTHQSSRVAFCSYSEDGYKIYSTPNKIVGNEPLYENIQNIRQDINDFSLKHNKKDDISVETLISQYTISSSSVKDDDRNILIEEQNADIDQSPVKLSLRPNSTQFSSAQSTKNNRLKSVPIAKDTKRTNMSRCTCPARYYLNCASRSPAISKSSKPIMKCTKPQKSATPVHLFQVGLKNVETEKSENASKLSLSRLSEGSLADNSKNVTVLKDGDDAASLRLSREPFSYSSIVALLPK